MVVPMVSILDVVIVAPFNDQEWNKLIKWGEKKNKKKKKNVVVVATVQRRG